MSDADREWTIEHAGEQLYDIISSLDYEETSVKMCGPTATDPTTLEQEEWRETFETVDAGERVRVALTPKPTGTGPQKRRRPDCPLGFCHGGRVREVERGWCLTVCGD